MIRGNVAVVRHGATAPSTQSGAVLLELSPSRMRDSGWDQLPPDVRFAGEALQKMRAPPWIAIYPNQPLTEKPSCEGRTLLKWRRRRDWDLFTSAKDLFIEAAASTQTWGRWLIQDRLAAHPKKEHPRIKSTCN